MAKKKSSSRKAGSLSDGGNLHAVAKTVLASVPGTAVSWKFHNASFDVGGKVFAFTRPSGMAMKLPEARIDGLVEKNKAVHLVMGKRTMREWAVVPADDAALLPLLKEAATFVISLQKRKP